MKGGAMGKLDGKVAIITGGASGIGESAVKLFVKEGARVLIADVDKQKGEELASPLSPRASFLETDVLKEPQIKAAVEEAIQRFGRLDCMFNNAGIPGPSEPVEGISVETFERTVGVVFRGVFLGMKHAAPVLKRQRAGTIINTASVAGFQAGYGPHIYSAAKAAVIHLTRSVAMELGTYGIRVNSICPGGIATPIFAKGLGLPSTAAARTLGVVEAALQNYTPLRRSGLPDDVAQAAHWLASDDASFVNGHALTVDGGLGMGRKWSDYIEELSELGSTVGTAL